MLLGAYTNHLIIKEQGANPELAEKLKVEADYYFHKAEELSPKRQEVLAEWIKTDILSEKYEKAKEKAQKCIDYNPEFRDCYWKMYLINVYLENDEEAEKYYGIAKEKRYPVNSETSLLELVNAYIKIEDYQKLAEVYQRLIKLKPEKVQYRASLAVCYKILGDYEKARQEALKTFELALKALEEAPEERKDKMEEEAARVKNEVEKFLRELER